MRKGDLDGAEKAQKKAIDLDPDFPGFHMQFSRLYALKNEVDKAIEEVRTAIDLNPCLPLRQVKLL